ncbi:MAG: hypothetical protein KDC44_25265, partial [Phaeodactylibacter sp.]|nr:hypothetical protein [Phaeodactylibacter sp.]
MTFRHLFPVLVGLFLPFFLYGQLLEWTFYTKEDGLWANEVGNIATLDNGLVWVISGNQSLRFDGRKFEEYPTLESFISGRDRLYGLQSLDDSLLCFSTYEKLILVNPRSGAVEYLPYPSRKDPEKELYFIMPTGPSELIFYFMNYLKSEYEIWRLKDRQFIPVTLPYGRYGATLVSVLKFESDRPIVLGKGKLSIFDSAGLELEAVDFSDYVDDDLSFVLKQDGPGDWVTFIAWGRFYQINLSDRTFRAHPANRFIEDDLAVSQNFIVDEAGNLWATGMDKLLLYYDVLQDTLYNFSRQFDEEIPYRCLFEDIKIDETGVIWVSTQLGLLKIVKQKTSFDTYLTGTAADNSVYSTRGITETEAGALYVGTYSGTIWIDPVQKQERLVSVPHDLPFHLYYQDSILWLNNGNAWDLKKETFHTVQGFNPYAQDRGTLAPDHTGCLWWVSSDRLSYRHPGEYQSAWQLAKRLPVSSQADCDALLFGTH